MRIRTTIAALAAVGVVAAFAPASTGSPATGHTDRVKAEVTVSVPTELVEGDRYQVEVRVARTAGARRVLLQHYVESLYSPGAWETVKATKVAGRKRHTFKAVAGEGDTERYRARVLYADARPAMSKTVATTVWHWAPLTGFDDYYSTGGSTEYVGFAMSGQQYTGWSTYSTGPSWETRWTVGRHCKALRGEVGLQDTSADGSSAVVRIVADETQVVFESVPLTPGMVQHVELPLATPYRLAVQARTTSPAGQRALPAFGTPELLCTGLD